MRPILPLPLVLLLVICGGCARGDEQPAVPSGPPVADAPGAATVPGLESPPAAPTPPIADGGGQPRMDDLVHADDSLEAVRARLGATNVVPERLPSAEGDTMAGWILFPADPSRRLWVYLDESGTHPMMLLAGKGATAWTRSDGVRIGMSSQELAQLNGGPFGFMGFDWDYGGVVTDWRGGRLAPAGASAGPVRLCRPEPAKGTRMDDYPVGDSEFSSDDSRMLTNPARVCEFGVNIDPPPAEPEAA